MKIKRSHWKILRIALVALPLGLAGAAGSYLVGRASTPYDRLGRPIVLSPDVVWARDYQTQAGTWMAELHGIDGRLRRLLSDQQMDLYVAADEADSLAGAGGALLETVSLTEPPPALRPLQQAALLTVQAYGEAIGRIENWLARPNPALQGDAAHSLSAAQAYLSILESSPWLTNK